MGDSPGSTKEAQGRVKEAVGDLTGDKDLEHKGQTEQAGEKVKQGVDDAVDKTKELIDRD